MPAGLVVQGVVAAGRAATATLRSRSVQGAGLVATAYVLWDEIWGSAKRIFGFQDSTIRNVEAVSSLIASGLMRSSTSNASSHPPAPARSQPARSWL